MTDYDDPMIDGPQREPPPEPSTSTQDAAGTKRQAVSGPSQTERDQLRSQINCLQDQVKQEIRRRKAQEASTQQQLSEVEQKAYNKAHAAAQREMERIIKDYEAAATVYYAQQNAEEIGKARQYATELRAALDQGTATFDEQMTAAAQGFQDLQNQLESERLEHEKELAEKTDQIMELMNKLRNNKPSAPSSTRPEPEAGQPSFTMSFTSRQQRHQRQVDRILNTKGVDIPILPLRPVSPTTNATPSSSSSGSTSNSGNPDPQDLDNASVQTIVRAFNETLQNLGLQQVIRIETGSQGKKKKGSKRKRINLSELERAVQAQRELLCKEDDLDYKQGLREVWRASQGLMRYQDFRGYSPADIGSVKKCDAGGAGPAISDYQLDFSKGYLSSLWNCKIIDKLVAYFFHARSKSPNGWGLPDVTDGYIRGIFHNVALKQSYDQYKKGQPRHIPELGRYETQEEVDERCDEDDDKRKGEKARRENKAQKLDRRKGLVEKQITLKMMKRDPDLKTWEYLKVLLKWLGVAGMSSEDPDSRDVGGIVRVVYTVRICLWRHPNITEYLQMIDKTEKRKANACPRVTGTAYGRSDAPIGLPLKMYNPKWLDEKKEVFPAFEEVLEVSQEAFDFLVVATSNSRV
ncbi:hypothetical protein R3P38DRAFT_3167899 [Favolaschia claudopus]|uniref:Uncharacterized protein n=1 Tax=Favolaschia claudopus TaxID=2862362 RepID=A0AAW0E6F1_9AGAR